jgi:hypothetical protein
VRAFSLRAAAIDLAQQADMRHGLPAIAAAHAGIFAALYFHFRPQNKARHASSLAHNYRVSGSPTFGCNRSNFHVLFAQFVGRDMVKWCHSGSGINAEGFL